MRIRIVRTRKGADRVIITPEQFVGLGDSTMAWKADAPIELDNTDTKKLKPIEENGRVVDYRDVSIRGYLSTFGNFDRDGEAVEKGAFIETLKEFMRRPTMLVDHRNSAFSVAGRFTKAVEDSNGLYVEGMLSNAPDMQGIRFRVAEGDLKTLSMGGVFHRNLEKRSIFKVQLFEGSIVAVPANSEAMFSVRTLADAEKKALRLGESFPLDNPAIPWVSAA